MTKKLDKDRFMLNSLAVDCPELTEEWHPTKNLPLTPFNVTKGTTKKAWWQCKKCQHEWYCHVSNRRKQYKFGRTEGTGCPNCIGRVRKPENSFAEKFPHLVKEWHPTKNEGDSPEFIAPTSIQKYWWICSVCEKEWHSAISSRACGSGCPSCAEFKNRKEPIKEWGRMTQNLVLKIKNEKL